MERIRDLVSEYFSLAGREASRGISGSLLPEDPLDPGLGSSLSPFVDGPDIFQGQPSGGLLGEPAHPLGTVHVQYLQWYKPVRDEYLTYQQETMKKSPFCTRDDREHVKSMSLRNDPKAQELYFQGLFSDLQKDVLDHNPEVPTGLFMHIADQEGTQCTLNDKTLPLEVALKLELSTEDKSLHGFAERSWVEFKSALWAFGVRKLGQLQTSAVVSSRALNYDVHHTLRKHKDELHSEYVKSIHKSIHGTEQMIMRGSESVEFKEDLWRLTWVEDVLNILQIQDGARQQSRGDWIRRVDMEASVITIPYAAARRRKGLLYTVVQLVTNQEDHLEIFDDPAVRAVVEYKWAAFGRTLVGCELSIYCMWLLSFVVFLLLLQDENVNRDSAAGRVMVAFNIIAFVCMLPFMIIEALQIYNYRLQQWLMEFWNFLDLSMMVIQWCCLFESQLNGRDQHWFRVALGAQVVLLFTKAQYFSRAFRIAGGSLVDCMRSVVYEIRWFLFSIGLTLVSFTFAFHVIFGSEMDDEIEDDEEGSELNRSFGNMFSSFISLFSYMFGGFELRDFDTSERPIIAKCMFILFQIVMALIILNLLIAVMTEAYVRATTRKRLMTTAGRAEMILELENLVLPDWFYGPKPPKFLHFLTPSDDDTPDSMEKDELHATTEKLKSEMAHLRSIVQDVTSLQRNDAARFLGHGIKSTDETVWKEGDYLRSSNGKYEAVFSDGELKFFNVQLGRCGWSLGISGWGAEPRQLVLETDGDLVMRDRHGHVGWSTGSMIPNAEYTLTLVDDGSFQLKDDSGRLSWFGPDKSLLFSLYECGYSDRDMPDLYSAMLQSNLSDDYMNSSNVFDESMELRAIVGSSSLGTKIVSHLEEDEDGFGVEDYLLSENKWYKAVLDQEEGQIVVYDQRILDTISRMPHIQGRTVWNSGTIPDLVGVQKGNFKVRFCRSGSLQIIAGGAVERVVWQSHPGDEDELLMPYTLELLDDRNLVIYDKNGELVWYSSGKPSSQGQCLGNSVRAGFVLDQFDHLLSLNGCFKAVMQENGEFAVYRMLDNECIWSTHSKCAIEEGPYRLVVSRDGIMQILSRDQVIKQIILGIGESQGELPFTLTLDDEGMLILYREGEQRMRVWDTGRNYDEFRPLGDSLKCTGSSSLIMVQGDMLVSQNKKYRFKIEPRGMAVVYEVNRKGKEKALYSIDGTIHEEPFRLEVCRDGNLKMWADRDIFYDAKCSGGKAPYRLMLLNNGALQLCDSQVMILWDIRNVKFDRDCEYVAGSFTQWHIGP